MDKMTHLREVLRQYQQEHLLLGYDKMNEVERKRLLDTIDSIDFKLMDELFHRLKEGTRNKSLVDISPVEHVSRNSIVGMDKTVMRLTGEQAIYDGELAVVTMAGGQGTRLGFNGPKGAFIFDKENNKSIFEALTETLKEACENYDTQIPWYIMTSRENFDQTKRFLCQHHYFGYPGTVNLFIQGELPMLDMGGKILLEKDYQIKMAANGHGGTLLSMEESNVIADMKSRGIKWVSINGVDNVLAKPVDPLFLGLAIAQGAQAGIKTIAKAYPEEKVGVVCRKNGKVGVVEYTEISEEMANLRGEDGHLVYEDAYALFSLFSIGALDQVSRQKLPYHAAIKKADFMSSYGRWVVAEKPNAIKFEQFIFDSYEMFDNVCVFQTNRDEEFAPIKNATGVDSPETAIKLYREYRNVNRF